MSAQPTFATAIAGASLWLLWMPMAIQAQTLFTTAVYFPSGNSDLQTQAQSSIDSLLARLRGMSDYELHLRAYTDDIGDADYNQQLATRRADAVYAYLTAHDFRPMRQGIEPVGELHADAASMTIHQQRAHNRRVEIEVVASNIAAWRAFFGLCSSNERQNFRLSSYESNFVEGAKGLKVHIPARSFAYPDDPTRRAPDSVVFVLQEAHQAADLIGMNLPTMSNGQRLETGGSFYLAAYDLQGNPLTLRQGRELLVSAPNENATADGMRIFVADRPLDDPAAPINWVATEETVQRPAPTKERQLLEGMAANAAILRQEMPQKPLPLPGTFPDYNGFPGNAPTLPQRPHFSHFPPPANDYFRYLYQELRARERMEMPLWRAAYRADKETYPQRLAAYETNLLGYQTNMPQMEQFAEQMRRVRAQFPTYIVGIEMSWLRIREFWGVLDTWERTITEYEAMYQKMAAVNYKERPKLYDEWATLLAENKTQVQALKTAFADLGASPYRTAHRHVSLLQACKMVDTSKVSLWSTEKWEAMNDYFKAFSETDPQTFFASTEKLLSLCEANSALLDTVLASKDHFMQFVSRLRSQRIGIFANNREALEQYKNVVGISQLGWVNIDALKTPPAEACAIHVQDNTPAQQARFYLIINGGKSVLEMSRTDSGLITAGLGKEEEVKIVGVRASLGMVEVFHTKGKAKDLHQIVPQFEYKPNKEVKSWLAGL